MNKDNTVEGKIINQAKKEMHRVVKEQNATHDNVTSNRIVNQPLISIVIPVYNVIHFLNDCLTTVSFQTYRNIEIILIDDGSTDGSSGICDNYVTTESRAIVVHQKNMGLSCARNMGIERSKGDFITFLDSDDMISIQYIEKLYSALSRTDSDIVVCDYNRISEREHVTIELHDNPTLFNKSTCLTIFNHTEAISAVYGKKHHGMQYIGCGKLFSKRLFDDNNIRFPSGKIHEDTFTIYKVLYAAHKICYIDEPLYLYRLRKGSIMNSGFSRKSLVKFDAIKEECKFFEEHNENDLYCLAFYHLLFEKKNTICEMITDVNVKREEIREFAGSLREDLKGYKGKNSIPLKKKLYYTALSYFPYLLTMRVVIRECSNLLWCKRDNR